MTVKEQSIYCVDKLSLVGKKKYVKPVVLNFRFIKDVDNLMKLLMLLDFGICSIQIGVILFQAITVSNN